MLLSCFLLVLFVGQMGLVVPKQQATPPGARTKSPLASSQAVSGSNSLSCQIQGQPSFFKSATHYGDITVSQGQTLIIANMTTTLIGNFIVDGGTLVIENSTVKGYAFPDANWEVKHHGCVQFSDSNDYVLDDFWVGGRLSEGSGTLIMSDSRTGIGVFLGGPNDTVDVSNTKFANFIQFTSGSNLTGGQVVIRDSIVKALALSFFGSKQGGQLSNLHPGYIGSWDIKSNLTGINVPYDMSLTNVTLVPNTVGPSTLGDNLGWWVMVGPDESGWPNLTISNSQLNTIGFSWDGSAPWIPRTFNFTGIPSNSPVNQVFFGSIKIANTMINGALQVAGRGNISFDNVPSLGCCWANGANQHWTFVDTSLTDFNPWNCERCTLNFVNSSWGSPRVFSPSDVPFLSQLPNASLWASARGYGTIVNATLSMAGNLTFYKLSNYSFPLWRNSTVTRTYPIFFTDSKDQGIPNLPVSLVSPSGRVIRQMTTNRNGRIDVPILFNDANHTDGLMLSTSLGGLSCQAGVNFTSSTPFRLGNIVSFNESGLPPGAQWTASINGTTLSSQSGRPINFCLSKGNYTFEVSTASGASGGEFFEPSVPAFRISPQSGRLALTSGASRVNISFSFQGSTLSIGSGTGAFSALTSSHKETVVAPGQRISGSITLTSVNRYGYPTSFIGTPSWGDPSLAYWTITNSLANGTSTLSVPVDLTAPTQPGTYHLFFAALDNSPTGTASQTVPFSASPVWNDGNDIASLNGSQVAQAQDYGFILNNLLFVTNKTSSTYFLGYVAVDVVKITVSTGVVSTTATTTASSTSATQTTNSSSSNTTPTSTGSGGIPEFPYQLAAATIFTALLVASYLLVRHRRISVKPSILHG